MPRGWSDSKDMLAIEANWSTPTSDGNIIARQYGLTNPQPVMCNTPQSGDCLYIIQSDNKYYIWNLIENDVFLLDGYNSKEDIIKTIRERGAGALSTKMVYAGGTTD